MKPRGRAAKTAKNGTRLLRGYKTMRLQGRELISGADPRLRFPARVGLVIEMPGKGIYLSTNRQYVLDYYSGLHDLEALVTLRFDPRHIVWGDPTDPDSEVRVSSVEILRVEPLS